MKGYSQRRMLEDEQWWLRFREYGISSSVIGTRIGVWGKDKLEYPNEPCLKDNDSNAKEKELQKEREAFLGGLLAMQANYELSHPKKESD